MKSGRASLAADFPAVGKVLPSNGGEKGEFRPWVGRASSPHLSGVQEGISKKIGMIWGDSVDLGSFAFVS